ncbi:MAG: hypothetical protein HFH47_01525 [Bacilli bacterium]|nr:hypothetical protein [Bacilli bacterium]
MSKKKIVLVLIIILIAVGLFIYFIPKEHQSNNPVLKNNEIKDKYSDLLLDEDTMEETADKFLTQYLNFDNPSIKSGKWAQNLEKYVDYKGLVKQQDNEIYRRLYDKEWQLSRMLNTKTYCELKSIMINYFENNGINITVIQNKNGSEDIDSPYFEMIQQIQTNYLLKFNDKYQIYDIRMLNEIILNTGSNYYNR